MKSKTVTLPPPPNPHRAPPRYLHQEPQPNPRPAPPRKPRHKKRITPRPVAQSPQTAAESTASQSKILTRPSPRPHASPPSPRPYVPPPSPRPYMPPICANSTMRLDQRYFKLVTTGRNNNHVLESYSAVHARSTMVLYSRQTKAPLAALTLKSAQDVGCLSMLTGRPSPKGNSDQPYFQGMLNMPDSNFSFVITNLSNEGMINFNVLHTPHRVTEVDPGPSYGLNEVNELPANQSYEITADQRTGRAMVLRGKTVTQVDPATKERKAVPLTVERSESTTDKDKEGLYFYLSVVPGVSSEKLVSKFEEGCAWKAAPGFVRRVIAAPTRPQPRTFSRGHRSMMQQLQHRRMDDKEEDLAMLFARLSACMEPEPGSRRTSSLDGSPRSMSARFIGGSRARAFAEPRSSSFRGDAGSRRSTARARSPSSSVPRQYLQLGAPAASAYSQQEEAPRSGESTAGFLTEHVEVGRTQAGELGYGDRVDVSSSQTGHEYSYENASEPAVLCLSIWDDMKFLPLLDSVERMLEAEAKEWVENEGKALVDSLNAVYKEDKCVIDLESEADTVVCTCGHQCINHANVTDEIKRCPICRSPVTAFVRADGFVI